MKRIAVIVGTRPDALKLIPLIRRFSEERIRHSVIAAGQHTDLLLKVLREYNIRPDHSISVRRNDITEFAGKYMLKLREVISNGAFSGMIVQGDTTTAAVSALAAYYNGIRVFHVEAGLRTGDVRNPFPEEGNRRMISEIAELHFAPSDHAARNLTAEGFKKGSIFVTGNTIIDLVKDISRGIQEEQRYVLITLHRRESWGRTIENICLVLASLSAVHTGLEFIFPCHPNPVVLKSARKMLLGARVKIIEPLGYRDFISFLRRSCVVMTDSGGVAEEASFLGKPLLILREKTERPEVVASGNAVLAGTIPSRIKKAFDFAVSGRMRVRPFYGYGKGHAAEKIASILKNKGYV